MSALLHRARVLAILAVSLAAALSAPVGANQGSSPEAEPPVAAREIAVLPLLNRTGGRAPVEEIREALGAGLEQRGLSVLPAAALERFMRSQRMRYTGGVDRQIALALRRDTGSRAVLVTSLDLYQEVNPPKVAMTSRLVSTTDPPRILWMDSAARTGDESPGILGLGLITELDEVLEIVIDRLSDSLSRSVARAAAGEAGHDTPRRARKRHRPKVAYAPLDRRIEFRDQRSLAVLPFANDSTTRYAGEILTDQLVRHLAMAGLLVLEPGVVRRMMLDARQIHPEGPSLPQLDLLRASLTVDAVIYGEVAHYLEGRGGGVSPVLGFSLRAIDTHDRQVFWSSVSHTEGDDGVFFFDVGEIASAHRLSSELASAIVVAWVGGETEPSTGGAAGETEAEAEKSAEELAILTGDAETLARLLDAVRKARDDLEKELEAARQESKLARAERDDLERRLAEIREQGTDSRRLLEEMTAERDGVARRMTDAERRESMLKDSIDALELLLDEARRRADELETALAVSDEARAALEQERDSLIAQIESLRAPAPSDSRAGSEPVPAQVASNVEAAVRAWAAAWSEQRVDGYLAAYSRSFQPSGGLSLDGWRAQRRLRLARPQFIELELEGLRVELADSDSARARFRQTYRSDTYADVVDKTLELRREADGWKIVRELVD